MLHQIGFVPAIYRLALVLGVGFAASHLLVTLANAAAAQDRPALSQFKDCETCPEMIALPAGQLVKQTPLANGNGDTNAALTKVALPAFAVSRFEVTVGDWSECVSDGACEALRENGNGSETHHPVTNVSWLQAQDYVGWLSEKTGSTYRLPTAEEWEYAARGGRKTSYSWGGDGELACLYANHDDLSYMAGNFGKEKSRIAKIIKKCDDGFWRLAPVGSLKPNDFGLYDTAGNVWEWTQSCWRHLPQDRVNLTVQETGPGCEKAELRGGAFRIGTFTLRPSNSAGRRPDFSNIDIGFRVVRDL